MGWRFVIYPDAAGEYRWRLQARNGEIVADSGEGYARVADAERAARLVRTNAREASLDHQAAKP